MRAFVDWVLPRPLTCVVGLRCRQLKWRTYKAVLKPRLRASASSAELRWARERMFDAATLAFVQRDLANPVEACIVRCGGVVDSTVAEVRARTR